MYDVLIIGCGIVGAATAFELSKYQLNVGVLERENDIAMGTTKANSAIIHAGYDPMPGTLMAKLNVRGAARAQELCPALDVPYQRCGSLVLALSKEDIPVLENLYHRGIANGVEGLALLGRGKVKTLEPSVSDAVIAALYAPSAAICSPWEYCLALGETAVVNGVQLHLNTAVTGLTPTADGWMVHTNCGDYPSRWVMNAAGVDAGQVHCMAAPPTFTIHPSKGQYHLLDKSEGRRVSRIIFQCPDRNGKGVLVAPTVHGNLIVGPNAEPARAGDLSTTAAGLALVRQTAVKSVPDIHFRDSIRSFAGLRANSDTGDFVLEIAAHQFMDLAGVCSPGLSAAPAIAEYAVELLTHAGVALEKKGSFTCRRRRVRFQCLSAAEKARLVASQPAYGRVICRCETITEGEILDALRAPIPPRSVDGVKRRVNAGMGRCQGGFCGPKVVEILAREWGCAPDCIVQDGSGAWMLARETKGGNEYV